MAQLNPKISFFDFEKNLPVTEVLVGRAIAIQVSGLSPNAVLTLKCDNLLSESWATFMADGQGQVNLSKQGPIAGSYSGIDVDGMFWSRTSNSNVPPETMPGPFVCRALVDNIEVASATLKKIFHGPDVISTRLNKDEVGFEAVFSTPAGEGPFPALLFVSGSEGGLDEFSPAYFASLGYATLSVGYYAMPGLPAEINRIPLEYFKKAIDWLKVQKSVKANSLNLYGVSRGGELALVLASTFPEDFSAVIANEPSGVVWASMSPGDDRQHSSWSFENRELPYVPFVEEAPHKEIYPDGREVVTYSNIFLAAIKNEEAVKHAIIPIEKFKDPILILAGQDDQIWPSCVLANFAIERRKRFGLDSQDKYYCFPKAGHTIGVPGAPLMDLTFYHPVAQEFWNAGGTPEGNAKAQRIGWDAVIHFLKENELKM